MGRLHMGNRLGTVPDSKNQQKQRKTFFESEKIPFLKIKQKEKPTSLGFNQACEALPSLSPTVLRYMTPTALILGGATRGSQLDP